MPTREILYDDVFDAQRHFRSLMDAMARPGTVAKMTDAEIKPPPGIHRASILVGFALLNGDVSFCVMDDSDKEIEWYILANTGSKAESLITADFIFLKGSSDVNALLNVKTGSLIEPEDSATLVLEVDFIGEAVRENSTLLLLEGPGIREQRKIFVGGVHKDLFAVIQDLNREFPTGVDLIITDPLNQLTCIPRSTKLEFQSL